MTKPVPKKMKAVFKEIPGCALGLPDLVTIGLVRTRGATRNAWHSHAGSELLFVLEGATSYEFKTGKAIAVHGGHFLVIPPNTRHRGAQNVRSPVALCGVNLLSGSLAAWKDMPLTAKNLNQMRMSFEKASFSVHPFSPALKWIINQFVKEAFAFFRNQSDFCTQAVLRTLLCAVMLEALRQVLATPVAPNQIVKAAIDYLRQHLEERVRMRNLVSMIGYSRSRVFQLFKAETGLTPHDFLQRLRIEEAQRMLKETSAPIIQVALATGFGSSQHFSAVFRRYTGQTPGRFRRL